VFFCVWVEERGAHHARLNVDEESVITTAISTMGESRTRASSEEIQSLNSMEKVNIAVVSVARSTPRAVC